MSDSGEMRIALSRSKLVRMAFGAMLVAAGGVWMLVADFSQWHHLGLLRLPFVTRGIGVLGLAFAGIGLLAIVRKSFDRRPGLVLSTRGFVDNSSGVALGRLVPWSDVTGFSMFEMGRSRSVVVHLARPDAWIEGGALQRRMLQANVRLCGSPIAIVPGMLDIGSEELFRTMKGYHARFAESRT